MKDNHKVTYTQIVSEIIIPLQEKMDRGELMCTVDEMDLIADHATKVLMQNIGNRIEDDDEFPAAAMVDMLE